MNKRKMTNYEQQAKQFAKLLIEMCFESDYDDLEDDDWYRIKACNYDGWQEVFCRWLFAFGYIDKDENKNYVIKENTTKYIG